MKKEMFIAVIIGLGFGLIITYGVYLFRSTLERNPTTNLEVIEVSPSPNDTEPSTISWHSPENESVQIDKPVTIAGTTLPSTYIVVFVNNTDYLTTSDATGNFTIKTNLEEGANIIRLHVLNESGEAITEERSVIVSSQLETFNLENEETIENEDKDES